MNQRETQRGIHSRIDTITTDDRVIRGWIRSFADDEADLHRHLHHLPTRGHGIRQRRIPLPQASFTATLTAPQPARTAGSCSPAAATSGPRRALPDVHRPETRALTSLAVHGFAEQLEVFVDDGACAPSTRSASSTCRSSSCTTASAASRPESGTSRQLGQRRTQSGVGKHEFIRRQLGWDTSTAGQRERGIRSQSHGTGSDKRRGSGQRSRSMCGVPELRHEVHVPRRLRSGHMNNPIKLGSVQEPQDRRAEVVTVDPADPLLPVADPPSEAPPREPDQSVERRRPAVEETPCDAATKARVGSTRDLMSRSMPAEVGRLSTGCPARLMTAAPSSSAADRLTQHVARLSRAEASR